jgi:hypothetical protein
MNNEVLVKLIDQLPQILTAAGVVVTAFGTIILGWLNYRRTGTAISVSEKAVEQGAANAKSIEVVRNDVNDKMQQFIEVTKASSHAEGKLEGEALPQRVAVDGDDPIKVEIVKGE